MKKNAKLTSVMKQLVLAIVVSFTFTSCVGYYYADGIYNDPVSERPRYVEREMPPQRYDYPPENRYADNGYNSYFRDKAKQYENPTVDSSFTHFTDVNSYRSNAYASGTSSYGGWGSNPSQVNVNVYNRGWANPYYGYYSYYGYGYYPYYGHSYYPYYGYGYYPYGYYDRGYYDRRYYDSDYRVRERGYRRSYTDDTPRDYNHRDYPSYEGRSRNSYSRPYDEGRYRNDSQQNNNYNRGYNSPKYDSGRSYDSGRYNSGGNYGGGNSGSSNNQSSGSGTTRRDY